MKCPFCRQTTTEVYNTRSTRFGSQTWRRRRCTSCHKSFTTYETPDLSFLRVMTSPGKRQRYSRALLYASLVAAFGSGTASATVESLTDTVETKLLDLKKPDLSKQEIAANVLSTLKHFNSAAFLRYLAGHAEVSTTAEVRRQLKKY